MTVQDGLWPVRTESGLETSSGGSRDATETLGAQGFQEIYIARSILS